eukprot:127268_1
MSKKTSKLNRCRLYCFVFMIIWMLLCITFLSPTMQDNPTDIISLQTQNVINMSKQIETNTHTIPIHSLNTEPKTVNKKPPYAKAKDKNLTRNKLIHKKKSAEIKHVHVKHAVSKSMDKQSNNKKSTTSKSNDKNTANKHIKKSTDKKKINVQSTHKHNKQSPHKQSTHAHKSVNIDANTSIDGDNIVSEIKIRFDIFYLIEYTNINVNIFDKHLTTHDTNTECIPSVYKLFFHDCCMSQFAINYLYSMGFTHIKQLHFNKWKENISNDDKVMTNDNITHIGCIGLTIEQKYWRAAKIFTSLGHKTTSYAFIMSYCTKYKIKKYCKRFLPTTYDLQISSQRIKFFKRLPCNNNPNNEWLLKSDAHGGNGVVFIKNSNYIRHFFLESTELNPNCIITDYDFNISKDINMSEGLIPEMVAQQLVHNAARINNCTFHIRTYIIVANYENPAIVLYAGSIILRSTNPSELRSNRHQSEHFKNPNDDLHWHLNMEQFADYYGDIVDVKDIEKQIKSFSKIVFLSAMKDVEMPVTAKGVQHYLQPSLDFIVTEDFKVKYLDFNTIGGTAHVPHCFDEIEGSMGKKAVMKDIWQCSNAKRIEEEMVNIEIEIAIKKQNGETLDKLDSVKTFEVILWE